MKIQSIHYSKRFEAQFQALSLKVRKQAVKKIRLFKQNPFYPSLRLHKLKGKLEGLWSISVDRKYRIIFYPLEGGVIILVSIGLHAIYE